MRGGLICIKVTDSPPLTHVCRTWPQMLHSATKSHFVAGSVVRQVLALHCASACENAARRLGASDPWIRELCTKHPLDQGIGSAEIANLRRNYPKSLDCVQAKHCSESRVENVAIKTTLATGLYDLINPLARRESGYVRSPHDRPPLPMIRPHQLRLRENTNESQAWVGGAGTGACLAGMQFG